MASVSDLWRVRGALRVPGEADDEGLLGRVADVYVQHGADIEDERNDRITFARPKYIVRLPVSGGEIRREGIRGLRVLRYDLPVLHNLPALVVHVPVVSGAIGSALVWLGAPPIAYLSAGLAMLLLYGMHYRAVRTTADQFLRRAFAT
jgi:hypothetical protein